MYGFLDHATHSGEFQDRNQDLFLAFGGANLHLKGTLTVTEKNSTYVQYNVKAAVTLTDTYTFEPWGPLGARLLFEQYNAANLLQSVYGYKSFDVEVKFNETYTGIRSYRTRTRLGSQPW